MGIQKAQSGAHHKRAVSYTHLDVYKRQGVGSYYVTVPGNTLPVKYTHTDSYGDSTQHTVEWQVEPSAWEGYALQKVEEDDLQQFPSANGRAGWYLSLIHIYSTPWPSLPPTAS